VTSFCNSFLVFFCRDIRQHDNSKQEWSDEELKKLYETHERLLDFVSLFCFVPKAKYLPLGPTRYILLYLFRGSHLLNKSFAGMKFTAFEIV